MGREPYKPSASRVPVGRRRAGRVSCCGSTPADGRIRTTRATFQVWEGGASGTNVVRGLRRCFGLRPRWSPPSLLDNEVGRLLETSCCKAA